MVDVDGITSRSKPALINPQQSTFIDQGFYNPYDMASGKPRHGGKTVIGNPRVFTIDVGFGTDGSQDDVFSAGEMFTLVN